VTGQTSPSVSVVIAVFNGERFVAEAIESVFAQDHRPLEVVVVDDGSTDASANVARSFEDVLLLRQGNEGPAAARNAGVARSSGELITFLDADDRMASGRITTQVRRLEAARTVGCVLMRQDVVLEPPMAVPSWLRPFDDRDDLVGGLMSTAMVRRETFMAVGGFDGSYRLCEDVDLLFRLREAGTVIEILPTVGVHRRIHRDNASHDVASMRSALSRAVRERVERQRVAARGSG
jgi:glycosyltransferase involved in cell wall biosynthesis